MGWSRAARRAGGALAAVLTALVCGAAPGYADPPDAVTGPRGATLVATGEAHSCTITTLGAVYCWGDNAHGQLGDGNRPVDRGTAGPVRTTGALADKDIVQLDAGGAHTCAVDVQGAVYCWGDNSHGQLGTGSADAGTDEPVEVGGLLVGKAAVKVVAGAQHTCALIDTGEVFCWGDDTDGQLGDDAALTPVAEPVPVRTAAPSSLAGRTVVDLTAHRRNTCAVDHGGAAHCWGADQSGQLGDGGAATDSPVPVAVDASGALAGRTLVQIDAGAAFVCAVATTGAAYCWGDNSSGALGNADPGTDRTVPVAVRTAGALDGRTLVQVEAGEQHACALDRTGAAYCWGDNGDGQLGNGAAPTDVGEPAAVAAPVALGAAPAIDIDTTARHTCAVNALAVVYCWGYNANGQLGDGTVSASDTPVPVVGLPTLPGSPTGVRADPRPAALRVSWRAPDDFGSGTLQAYVTLALPAELLPVESVSEPSRLRALVQAARSRATAAASPPSDPSFGFCVTRAATACTVSGLTAGRRYLVLVLAVTTDGISPPSEPVYAVPASAVLPVTGAGVTGLLAAGLALVGLGAVLLRLRRRRAVVWAP